MCIMYLGTNQIKYRNIHSQLENITCEQGLLDCTSTSVYCKEKRKLVQVIQQFSYNLHITSSPLVQLSPYLPSTSCCYLLWESLLSLSQHNMQQPELQPFVLSTSFLILIQECNLSSVTWGILHASTTWGCKQQQWGGVHKTEKLNIWSEAVTVGYLKILWRCYRM